MHRSKAHRRHQVKQAMACSSMQELRASGLPPPDCCCRLARTNGVEAAPDALDTVLATDLKRVMENAVASRSPGGGHRWGAN